MYIDHGFKDFAVFHSAEICLTELLMLFFTNTGKIRLRKKILLLAAAIMLSVTANYSINSLYAGSFTPPPLGPNPDSPPPFGEPPAEGMPPGGGPGMQDRMPTTFSGVFTQKGGSETKKGSVIIADQQDQSAMYLLKKGKLVVSEAVVKKTGNTSSDDGSNFYGLNAGILVSDEGILSMNDSSVQTDGEGANAVFSSGKGSSAVLSKVTIRTVKNSSRGVDATMGGAITGTDLDIETKGEHCAAVATDRGEGTITIIRGRMKTSGPGSPAIYSTGNISVTDAVMSAAGSEAAVIEGKNSITLVDTVLSGEKKCGAMLYQSFSGDAGVGTSVFKMTGGSLTSKEGPLFYITNTNAKVFLKNAKLSPASGVLISAQADRWGKKGSNGGHLEFNADGQVLKGDISADKISSVSVVLKNGSSFEGSISNASISLDADSVWSVKKDSFINALAINSGSNHDQFSQIKDNGHTIVYNSSLAENKWLEGEEYKLQGGGKLTPEKGL